MASKDLKSKQRDAVAAEQRRGKQNASTADPRSPIASLQSQHTQSPPLYIEDKIALGVPQQTTIGEQYLVFSLFEREFAFKAENIQGVERLVDVTPVPNVAPWVRGVMNLRGSISSVVDLRTFLDMEPLLYSPRTRLLSVQYHEMVICLAVDSVNEMIPIPTASITGINARQTPIPQWATSYASGSASLEKRVIVLLDAARLLFSEKMQHYEALD